MTTNTMGRDEAVECPECGRKWPWESEQAVAVGLQGACIACTSRYPDGAHEESQRRHSSIVALRDGEDKQPAPKPDAVTDVEVAPGVKLPFWLLDYAQKVDAYMKLNYPGPWKFGGIQSRNDDKPDAVAGLVEKVKVVKILGEDDSEQHRVELAVGVQKFRIGPDWDTKEEADWYADQFRAALAQGANDGR